MRLFILAVLLCSSLNSGVCQNRPRFVIFRPVHLGITPGVGTNGIYDLKHENNISINLFSGQNWQNNYLSLSGISQFTVSNLYGINIAGISSIVGAVPFVRGNSERDSLAYMKAIQVAGLINSVNGKAEGLQISGVLNTVVTNFNGVQIGGLGNYVGDSFEGFQVSLLANSFQRIGIGIQSSFLLNRGASLSGAQLFALVNTLNTELDGLQLGAVNYVGNQRSVVDRLNRIYWMQIGLYNRVIQNGDGMQVGLINRGGNIGFSQVGLINFSKTMPQYPIGPLNFSPDMEALLRFYYNSLFPYNIELGTGSLKVMNTLAYSFDPGLERRGILYTVGKHYSGGYQKEEYFVEGNLGYQLVFEKGDQVVDWSSVYKARLQAGYCPFIRTKAPDFTFFLGLTANAGPESVSSNMLWETNSSGTSYWLDFNFGIHL
jgi:hypothetical protein